MRKLFNQLELYRQVGMIISFVALIASIFNFVQLLQEIPPLRALSNRSVYVVLISSLLLFLLSMITKNGIRMTIVGRSVKIELIRLIKFLQILIILTNGTFYIIDAYNSFAGMGLILIAILLIYKYGMMNKMYLPLLLIYSVVIIEISAFKVNKSGIALEIILFTAMFLYIFYLSFQHEINKSFKENSLKEMELIHLKKILKTVVTPNLNPVEMGLTKSEMKILRILCLYNASNKEISQKLNISVSTVKNHMGNIFNKIGAEDRYQLIDLCKYYVIELEQKKLKNST